MNGRLRFATSLVMVLLAYAPLAGAATDRPLSTDRPDRTESPYSVPAEHFQVELDFATLSQYDIGGTDYNLLTVAPVNLKYGFTDHVDVQLLFTPYLRVSYDTDAGSESEGNTGPLGVRFKINLAGNDSGTAVALLPYVIAPTDGNEKGDNTLFGLAVPVGIPIGDDRAVGLMAGYEQIRDGDLKSGFASATLGTPLAGRWSTFFELYYALIDVAGDEENIEILTFDTGLIYAQNDNLTFDAGVYFGLTDEAENWRVFAGMSFRTN